MQTVIKHALLLLLMSFVCVSSWASQDGDVVLQEQWGRQIINVAADQEITFYDWKGTGSIASSSSNNSRSLTVFKPAEGMSIQITFESIDVTNDGTGWMGEVWVYSGDPDPDGSFKYNDALSSTSTMPDGTVLDKLDGTYSNKTYTSASADGSLSVGMLWRYAKACDGWVAKVKCVTLEDMTVTGAGSNYDGIGEALSSRQNVALANAYVTATGVMNPDHVTNIGFTMTKNDGAFNPLALRLLKDGTQVDATVSADGDGYVFTLDEALSDGTTTFTIAGDFLATSAVGAKAQVDITKIASTGQADGIAPFTSATSVEVVNPAIVIMGSEAQTVTVGETSLAFFDEGGKAGGIQAKTNGQVTFLSGEEGKKVMVNFTSNNIWHGTYYNQELRIYNGQEVSDANLIKTLQKDETGIVRSTAEDGSLTVVLFSDASSTTAADGFEASVSLFTPQAMTFDGITTAAASTETVAAGDAEQDMLTINVKTKDTEPAMQVTKMAFSAGETNSLVTKASLYYGTAKVGEADVNAASFTIDLQSPQALVEGDNAFTLKYTISDEALNDQTVSAQLASVTALVNNAEATEAVTAEASVRTVKNIAISHASQGTVTKTVNGSLGFETKKASEYSSYCEAGTDDRVNVFVPKHDGMVCQIDFSEFDVTYSSTIYGTKSVFKIYAGQGTTGTLLWELNNNSQQSTGPGSVIRSSAADGALTVIFNPNSSYGYYSKGWKATVSEYQPVAMSVDGVEVSQTSVADASVGATNLDLLTVNVKTTGNLESLQLGSMKLNLKGTEANIGKVSIWQGDVKIGEAAAAAEVEVAFPEAVELTEGNNMFTVKADVSDEAVAGTAIDAKVTAVKCGTQETVVEAGDPEGSRTLKLMYVLQSGDNGVVTITEGNPIMFYDDGGADGNASASFTGTVTFAPKSPADGIMLTFKAWDVYYTTKLNIFQKDNAEGTYDAQYSTYDNVLEQLPVRATSQDGKITLQFITGTSGPAGFAIEVSAYTKQDVYVKSVTTEDISVNEVLKGQTDTRMLKIAVKTDGEKKPLDITGFNFADADNACVSAQHIYQTGTVDGFSANEEFNGTYTISTPGTYYFWLAYDISPEATVGQTATASLAGIVAGGETIAVSDEPAVTASVTVAQGKSGTYTVGGTDADYATIQSAIDDLSTRGMEGPVTLNIRAGEYNERVRIPYIKGMGSANTLTIQSESGNRDVKIYHDQYTSNGYSDDQYSKVYGVVTFYEASYVTLRGVEVTTTDQSYDAVVMVKNQSRHVTIDDCYIHAATTTSYQQDINLIGHYAQDVANCNNDYLTVSNSLLEGGYIGVSMGGTSYVALPKEVGGVIEGNTFKNQGSKAIYCYDELGVKVKNNTVIMTDEVTTNATMGALDFTQRDTYTQSSEITGNTFNLAPSMNTAAMYLRQMAGTAEAPVIIANNVVNVTSLNTNYGGVKLSDDAVSNVYIANNTIRLHGENTGPALWLLDKPLGENVNVVNNIIQNEGSGYAVNLYNDENLDKITFKNNIIYTAGATFFRATSGNEGDFAAFVQKTGATGSINKQVSFLSDAVLEPADNLDGDLLKALPLDYVTTDVNGKARPAEDITIGAYEYDADAASAPVILDGYPAVTAHIDGVASITVKTDMASTVYYIVKKATEDAPTTDELAAADTKQDVAANTETSITISNLTDGEEYVVYMLPISLRGNAAESISQTETFTMEVTPVELVKPEAMVFINNSNVEETVTSGSTVKLFAMVTVDERTAPYTLTWMDQKHNVLLTQTFNEKPADLFMAEDSPTQCTDYIFLVTDSKGGADTATVRAIVTGDMVPATFEDLYLEDESYEDGRNLPLGSFVSGSFKFDNFYSQDYGGYWGNYGYTNMTSTHFDGYFLGQWKNVVGSGAEGSETFMVAYPGYYGGKITVMNNPEGDVISGCCITNSAYTLDNILNGDGMSSDDGAPFGQGDYLKLTITADNGKSLDFYLADYRAAEESDRYYVNDWTWVDLSVLGTVKELTFTFDGTKKNNWGLTTATYFCMDNLGGEAPESTAVNTVRSTVSQSAATYDISGRKTESLKRGINIIRMNDGTIRKVMVK